MVRGTDYKHIINYVYIYIYYMGLYHLGDLFNILSHLANGIKYPHISGGYKPFTKWDDPPSSGSVEAPFV